MHRESYSKKSPQIWVAYLHSKVMFKACAPMEQFLKALSEMEI